MAVKCLSDVKCPAFSILCAAAKWSCRRYLRKLNQNTAYHHGGLSNSACAQVHRKHRTKKKTAIYIYITPITGHGKGMQLSPIDSPVTKGRGELPNVINPADEIRKLREGIRPKTHHAKTASTIHRLCLACTNKRAAVVAKARALAPGTKCDNCEAPAVMAVEYRPAA